MTMVNSASSDPGPGNAPGYAKYPEYQVTMAPFKGRVRVHLADLLLADSHSAILLTETDHSPVYYLPRADVRFELLEAMERSTYCPFKGHASYWRVAGRAAQHSEPIVWGYECPFDEVSSLSKYVAFYSDRVNLEAD